MDLNRNRIFLLVIFLIALILRLYGINWSLPYPHEFDDEAFIIMHALKFGTGDLNPHWFTYPSLYMYVLFVLYGLLFVLGLAVGFFNSTRDFIVLFFTNPSVFYLIGRFTTALLGSLTIILLYFIGKRAFNEKVGLLASFFLAFTFIHVELSHIALTDVPMTFFMVFSFYFAIRVLENGQLINYIFCGLLAGFAAATKYPGGTIILSLVVAHLLKSRTEGKAIKNIIINKRFAIGIFSLGLGFIAGCPYALLDFKTFFPAMYLRFVVQNEVGWLGQHRGETFWIKSIKDFLPDGMGILLTLISLLGVGYAIYRRRKSELLIVTFPVFYYILLAGSHLNIERYWLPVFPFLNLLSARFLERLAKKVFGGIYLQYMFLATCSILLIIWPAYKAVKYDHLISRKDTRIIAKEWIESSVPSGTKIAIEKGGPPILMNWKSIRDEYQSEANAGFSFPESESYMVVPRESVSTKSLYYELLLTIPVPEPNYYVRRGWTVAEKSLEYYERNDFEYIVISEQRRRAYIRDRDRYREVGRFYEMLDAKYPIVKVFTANSVNTPGPTISVYKIVSGN